MMITFGSCPKGGVMDLLVTLIIVSILMWLLPMGIALWRGVDDLGLVFMINILCLILPLLWFVTMYLACASPKRLPPQRRATF
jgi:hypothetical protein